MTAGNRRPLSSRNSKWAAALTRWLAARAITPNQISMLSMVAAGLSAVAFAGTRYAAPGAGLLLFVAAALFIQARLVCNLLDGMVAIEAGKSAPDGPFWNEAPDRISDMLILAGAGVAAGQLALGFAAAACAVLTAYIRELGRASGLPADFSGPMAKQHRMAVMTLAAVLAAFLPLAHAATVIAAALWIVAAGSAYTALRRSMRLIAGLHAAGRKKN